MSIFKCKMCGGALEIKDGTTVCECEYCGTKQTLPKLDDDKKANLYDRANHFRRNNEYDKAMGIYEQILSEDNTDSEAYWSLVLCRYGIEYVEDPSTHKRIPTINRTQFTSIFADEDYKSALQYADGYQREIYEQEAKAIDKIQKDILAISQKEEPFDVFICYKETDNNGRRTQDSVLANDLYHQLKQEGFKVFFSRITLEDKLGSAYEPYIFAALNSAKVMVVLGTKPEYFNAVWVKNEWSRYLTLVKQSGGKKVLIPAYRDMDPYDLPEEFSHLQAQDMSKLGFMQDLIRVIGKIIAVSTPKVSVKEDIVINNGNTSIAPLLKRVFIFIEDGNWEEADKYCEKVLDQDPENVQAYLGKLLTELKVKKREQLAECAEPFDDRDNYNKILRFGDESLKAEMRGYITHIKNRNENTRLTDIYNRAKTAMNEADTEADFESAANMFASISGFKDSDELLQQCTDYRKDAVYTRAKSYMTKENISAYETAIKIFQSIPSWKDSDDQICICRKKIDEIREKDRLKVKKLKKAFIIVMLIVCACIAFVIILTMLIIPARDYNKAISLINNGKIVDAYENLIALNGYKDSASKAKEIFDQYKIEKLKVAEVGDIVFFGTYEQDNEISNGKENIEWRVLAKENNKILIISDKGLDCQVYDTLDEEDECSWENCTLRKWLNDDFLNEAFSAEEQSKIQITNVRGDESQYNMTSRYSYSTEDMVFLLSINEVKKYFSSQSEWECKPTDYAVANGASVSNDNGNCWWWLRSPGDFSNALIKFVSADGVIDFYGSYATTLNNAIRPAMWIETDS